jgi:UDP-2,3-diacylglucosamine pyrophosphatase LpxH
MWDVEELFVLSDLHLAAERGSGLFRADAELADCLRWILTETRDSVTVLAGDVLDFLIVEGGQPETDFESLGGRTREILRHHEEVFEALACLVRSPRHRLVIMGGNHDPELIFPSVQEAVERRLGLDGVGSPVRWLVQGEALRVRVGGAVVLVEHGNVLDPWNRIDHAALQSSLSLASRNLSNVSDYQPPPGSRLVLEVANDLRGSYRWIDCLKPETEAVLPLLWHFASWKHKKLLSHLVDDYLHMKTVALVQKTGNWRNPDRLYKGEHEAENSPADRSFKEWVDVINERQRLTRAPSGRDRRMIEKLRSVSARDTFFDLEEPDGSTAYLRPVFEGGSDLVIHGHTHSAKACVVEGGFYVNTGTWGQLMRLPKSYEGDDVWEEFLDLLGTNEVESFCLPTFARVRRAKGREETEAALLEWRRGGPHVLSSRRFSDRQTGWRP